MHMKQLPHLQETKKRASTDNSVSLQKNFSKLHSSIDRNNVNSVYDPVGDGYCGYRAISYLRYGDENRYKDVKKDMLVALNANKDAYSRFFDFDTVIYNLSILPSKDCILVLTKPILFFLNFFYRQWRCDRSGRGVTNSYGPWGTRSLLSLWASTVAPKKDVYFTFFLGCAFTFHLHLKWL
ncbi:hypothetical protein BDF21DRAFT_449753 [Thamnidium elegans]|nr:hypothetical protein BDF21DRAFT_449753 [Thamnidium elegans]